MIEVHLLSFLDCGRRGGACRFSPVVWRCHHTVEQWLVAFSPCLSGLFESVKSEAPNALLESRGEAFGRMLAGVRQLPSCKEKQASRPGVAFSARRFCLLPVWSRYALRRREDTPRPGAAHGKGQLENSGMDWDKKKAARSGLI